MDSVQFKNIGLAESQNTQNINRRQSSVSNNTAQTQTKATVYQPASYTSTISLRNSLTTKDEKKKYKSEDYLIHLMVL